MNNLLINKGKYLFEESQRNGFQYRAIIELLARFGYISIREVMYALDLPIQGAINRLFYLESTGLIERFLSLTIPEHFFCLTRKGVATATLHQLSDEIHRFRPYMYNLIYQIHDRSIIKSYIALKKVLGQDFGGWVSEQTLKQEAGASGRHQTSSRQRILDGEFSFTIHKARHSRKPDGSLEKAGEEICETWRGGVELELSLKSPNRYRKQFRNLENKFLITTTSAPKIQMVLFLCGSDTIFDRLIGYMAEKEYRYGNCVFLFGQAQDFLRT